MFEEAVEPGAASVPGGTETRTAESCPQRAYAHSRLVSGVCNGQVW